MNITMLGTGNAMVTECYNTCFVLSDEKGKFLVDGGGGNTLLRQLKRSGIAWQDLHEIFVTHKHVDHLLGIIWMVRMICQYMSQGQYEGEANIYAHDEVIPMIERMAKDLLQEKQVRFLGDRLHLITVRDGETRTINERPVTFFNIRSTKAKQFGFSVELDEEKRLVCCGDEPYADCEYSYVKDADWVLHEAFCLHSQAEIFKPYEKHHSTVKDACELAEKLNVKNLLLYHTEDRNIKHRKELYLEEGQKFYRGNLFVPDDLEVIKIL